jgi:hypothetical protein
VAWYDKLISSGVDTIIGSVGNVLDNLFTTDDEKQKNKIALTQITLAAAQAERELAADLEKAYLEDAKDMRRQLRVELQSQDAFVRRARPTFNYIFYTVLIFNFIFIPIYQLITGSSLDVIELPTELWTVFGVGFIGYGYLRTVEKTAVKIPRIGLEAENIFKEAKG